MFTQKRHTAILQLVSDREIAMVTDLMEESYSSKSTIRGDLCAFAVQPYITTIQIHRGG